MSERSSAPDLGGILVLLPKPGVMPYVFLVFPVFFCLARPVHPARVPNTCDCERVRGVLFLRP